MDGFYPPLREPGFGPRDRMLLVATPFRVPPSISRFLILPQPTAAHYDRSLTIVGLREAESACNNSAGQDDGKVDFHDLVTLGRNYGQPGGWLQGNFDWDQIVDFNDLVSLARNYDQSISPAELSQLDPAFRADVERAFAAVPEPSCLLFLSLAEVLVRRRRPK